eukprot:COSAG01_NODE_7328_length_3249_cov_4.434286_4_plen_116_part_00
MGRRTPDLPRWSATSDSTSTSPERRTARKANEMEGGCGGFAGAGGQVDTLWESDHAAFQPGRSGGRIPAVVIPVTLEPRFELDQFLRPRPCGGFLKKGKWAGRRALSLSLGSARG